MNPELVEDAKEDDKERTSDDKLVLEEPALRRLNEGSITRNGQTTSVLPPEGDSAFNFHPDNLRIPLDQLKERYDAETWKVFVRFAKTQKLDEDQTLWSWLAEKPKRPTRPGGDAKDAGPQSREDETQEDAEEEDD